MRRVKRPRGSRPAWLQPAAVKSELTAIARSGNTSLIREAVYAFPYMEAATGKRASHTRDVLNTFYFHKCAYCEKYCRADVEHYRPKGNLSGPGAHSGYPWLCYEWSNLLPACTDCNGRSGKRSRFPVAGGRVTAPHPHWLPKRLLKISFHQATHPYLLAEAPLLLHPERDDPTAYLAFRPHPWREGFEIYGLDAAGRGEMTAEICHLNRPDLLAERLEVLRQMRRAVKLLFKQYRLGRISDQDFPPSLKLLFEQWQEDSEDSRVIHTLLRKFVMANAANFDLLVVPLLDSSQQPVVSAYFKDYKTACFRQISRKLTALRPLPGSTGP